MRRLTDEERGLRVNARQLVQAALSSGRLVRPHACENCGARGRECRGAYDRPQAHHEDYTKPLEIQWLCQGCHIIADVRVRRKARVYAKKRRGRPKREVGRYNGFTTFKEWKLAKFPVNSSGLSS